jgi:hypothetical protein
MLALKMLVPMHGTPATKQLQGCSPAGDAIAGSEDQDAYRASIAASKLTIHGITVTPAIGKLTDVLRMNPTVSPACIVAVSVHIKRRTHRDCSVDLLKRGQRTE